MKFRSFFAIILTCEYFPVSLSYAENDCSSHLSIFHIISIFLHYYLNPSITQIFTYIYHLLVK
jgi:hypothetical protein